MLTCKQATRLASESFDRRLAWRERLGLRVHLLLCVACARFARQIRFLREAARQAAVRAPAARMPLTARRRIAGALQRKTP